MNDPEPFTVNPPGPDPLFKLTWPKEIEETPALKSYKLDIERKLTEVYVNHMTTLSFYGSCIPIDGEQCPVCLALAMEEEKDE